MLSGNSETNAEHPAEAIGAEPICVDGGAEDHVDVEILL
jgi:hypothetical protein